MNTYRHQIRFTTDKIARILRDMCIGSGDYFGKDEGAISLFQIRTIRLIPA